jgi:hypothetical protein
MMPIPPLVQQLRQKRKQLEEQFRSFGNIVTFDRMATPNPDYPPHLPTRQFERLPVLDDMETTLREMLSLIEKIKQS